MSIRNRELSDKARVRFRYVEFDVEGGNASIQEGLRNIASALARGAPIPKTLPAATEAGARKNGEAATSEQLPLVPAPPDGPTTDADTDAEPRRPRKYTTPSVINGLDLEGKPSLAEFAKEKALEGHTARYLGAAVWLKQQKGLSEFTADHMFTVYKLLGWPTAPADVGMPLRHLKRQRLLDSGSKAGSYVVNDAGIAAVARMPETVA